MKKQQTVFLTLRFPESVGYADRSRPLVWRVANAGTETLAVRIAVKCAEGLVLPYEREAEIPYEGEAEFSEELFSPLFLAENDGLISCKVEIEVYAGEELLTSAAGTVRALPFGSFERGGDPFFLPAFIRPALPDCERVLSEAGKILKKWGMGCEFTGYTGDKDAAIKQFAALFCALKKFPVEREEDEGELLSAFREKNLRGKTNDICFALFAAACLERARFNPVVAVGEGAGVGIWLHDSSLLDAVEEDGGTIAKYLGEGVDEMCMVGAEDLFRGSGRSFSAAAEAFRERVERGALSFVDVRRCRAEGVLPCPVREGTKGAYRLIPSSELFSENPPAPLKEAPLREEREVPAARWERELLDLSGKNRLLVFREKQALFIDCDCEEELFSALRRGNLRMREGKPLPPTAQRRELLRLEWKKGIVRARGEAGTAALLFRRNREAEEETGARPLYLALGFLRYTFREGKEARAPLLLVPATLSPAAGGGFFLSAEDIVLPNDTLFEWLGREHRLKKPALHGGEMKDFFAAVRAQVKDMRGWDVEHGAALSLFSFPKQLLWNDLHAHIGQFERNALFRALLYREPVTLPQTEGCELFLPLPCDDSQRAAVARCAAGESFVLHGPPGTGKSQTIANMIATCLAAGKRVLFVAEKRAACEVVQRRLHEAGVGDFCMLLHTDGDEEEGLEKLRRTLALKADFPAGYQSCARELASLEEEGAAPLTALHERKKAGFSVYEGILSYFKHRGAPEVIGVESAFLGSLTAEKTEHCRQMIRTAAAAAKECGKLAPFRGIGLTACTRETVARACGAAELLLSETEHFKRLYALFLETYRQRGAALTAERCGLLVRILRLLSQGETDRYFAGTDEESFERFYRANRQLDESLAVYARRYERIVALPDPAAVLRALDGERDPLSCPPVRAALKRLCRAGETDDPLSALRTLAQIHLSMARIRENTDLSAQFTGRDGYFRFEKRESFLAPLYALEALCGRVFQGFNAESFHAACIRTAGDHALPLRLLAAYEGFREARSHFFGTVHAADGEEGIEACAARARSLIGHADLLPAWCGYRATAEELSAHGLKFLSDALEEGTLDTENILAGFEKSLCKRFLDLYLPADPVLSRAAAEDAEETAEKYAALSERCRTLTREELRARAVSRLPREGEEGEARALLLRAEGKRGLRALFGASSFLARTCPCLLMSPATVAQYLPAEEQFDVVIFDEASQMTSAEAAGSLARARQAIVAGDPKQLPPTSFFRAAGEEREDAESVLEDCLSAGLGEAHLLWHYRSRHESLIAFSNARYYEGALCTVPSPAAGESRVRLLYVKGNYDRGKTKRNKKEAEALAEEVLRRLRSPVFSKQSMGIVTFSAAQQEEIGRILARRIAEEGLEEAAYAREEPLFIKNLETVQGDERDVILFSVCYGPSAGGKLSLNFGPLNRAGGWRRLNVAVSRAREEMLVFTGISASQIDLNRSSSRGVAELKAFLEYAESGKLPLPARPPRGEGLGLYLARELLRYGYDCRCGVGTSAFRVDVGVLGGNGKKYLLGILFDDRATAPALAMQARALKRAGWNILLMRCVQFYFNPAREIARVKETLDVLSGGAGKRALRYADAYRAVGTEGEESAAFVTEGKNDEKIRARIRAIVETEEPVSRAFLKKRVLATFGIRGGNRVNARLDALIAACMLPCVRVMGTDYFYRHPSALGTAHFRTEEGAPPRRTEEDFTVFEMLSLMRGALEERVSMRTEELSALVHGVYPNASRSESFFRFLRDCISYGEEKGLFVRSAPDLISLA